MIVSVIIHVFTNSFLLDPINMGGGVKGYNSDTGGVIPMNIAGRMAVQRERLFGMSDAERAWRAQYLKDQHLAPHEPVEVPGVYEELYNPIRRFYRAPMDAVQRWLAPRVVSTEYQGWHVIIFDCLNLDIRKH